MISPHLLPDTATPAVMQDCRNESSLTEGIGRYSLAVTEPEGLGRRLARYRKRLGFSRARDLPVAT